MGEYPNKKDKYLVVDNKGRIIFRSRLKSTANNFAKNFNKENKYFNLSCKAITKECYEDYKKYLLSQKKG